MVIVMLQRYTIYDLKSNCQSSADKARIVFDSLEAIYITITTSHNFEPLQESQNDIDMLPIQPDTVLDMKNTQWFDAVPEEADIPLSVGCLESNPIQLPRPMTKEEVSKTSAVERYFKSL